MRSVYFRGRRWARRPMLRGGAWRRRGPGCLGCGFVLLLIVLAYFLLQVAR